MQRDPVEIGVEQCSRQNLRALGRRFCRLAEVLSRESRQSASFYELHFCRGLHSM